MLTRADGCVDRAGRPVAEQARERGLDGGALELAGIQLRPQDFILMLSSDAGGRRRWAHVGGCGSLCVLPVLVPVITKIVIGMMTSRRQRAFDGQLHDAMQTMAGNLRAGHSLLQALDSVAQQAPAPLSEEFTRVVNETRVGRDVGLALEETAARMDSKDMKWVAQAIMINRQTGGNLAEVLDQVGATIRERGQIKRQVQALAAEGKLSANVLMALPFGVGCLHHAHQSGYLAKFTESLSATA